ncbi:hypothetical protein EDE15_2352 [Edaphobacter aggregans]|uniref:Fibronectin type-III domain-containing protein n=1 Tax=Edaphobacter aggregans TaxID=570835 RepID=A0A428MJ02_9BACT|nr:fibronectin type III domain-containing protein [Edaphobacter aggregans]RSL16827.1 hypothetical protein EDE15_2352 [Edaphobacter aggregans]
MTFEAKPHRQHLWRALSTTLLLPLAIGCASPGPPRPPSLHLPEVVTDLTAQRIGDHVQLHWTTPSNTTDGINITGTMTAQLCRETKPTAPSPSSACTRLPHFSVRPGPSQTIDPLPPSLTIDPVTLLAYHIEIFNAAGHSAGLSAQALTATGAAPPQIEHLRATPARVGATLEWQSPKTSSQTSTQTGTPIPASVELDRIHLPNPSTPPKPPAKTPPSTASKPTSKPASKPPLQFSANTPNEVHLTTKDHTDIGGTLDTTALKGETYTYTAQRVRTVTLDGHTLELRSPLTPPVTLQIADIFPPAIPAGLAAVPSAHSIDLSWQPGADPDLVGYHVYRRSLPSQEFVRLTQTPVVGPAFSDQTAEPGHTYAYRITAIDATGNQSPPSTEVQETLREP